MEVRFFVLCFSLLMLNHLGCVIGLILGTGANACYLEDLKRVKKMEGITNDSLGKMVINMECGM